MDCSWAWLAVFRSVVRVGAGAHASRRGVEGNDSAPAVSGPADAGAAKLAQRRGCQQRHDADADSASDGFGEPAERKDVARRKNGAGSAGQYRRAYRYDDDAVAGPFRQRAGYSGARREIGATDERRSGPLAKYRWQAFRRRGSFTFVRWRGA